MARTGGGGSLGLNAAGPRVEQIDVAGAVLFHQHDHDGATRLLTHAAGAVAATFTYDAHGTLTGHTRAADTGLY